MPEVKKVPKPPIAEVKKVAKETKEKEKVAAIPVDLTCQYESTGKYSPKAAHNIQSYGEVCDVLPATYKEIQAAIPEHTDFVGYLIRRGGLAPVGR